MNNQPALKAVLILTAGIIGGRFLRVPFLPLLLFAGLSGLLAVFLFITKKANRIVQILLILLVASVGHLRYRQTMYMFPSHHIRFHADEDGPVVLQGYLVKDPEAKVGRVEFLIESLCLIGGETLIPTRGKVLATLYDEPPGRLRYGDVLFLTGNLRQPEGRRNPGGFDYRSYLARKGIHAVIRLNKPSDIRPSGEERGSMLMRSIVYPARRFVIQIIDKTTEGQARAVLKALIVGERGTITPEVRDRFARAGVIHILAVSGLHVGFVLIILMTLFGLLRFPYYARVWLVILGLVFYCLLTEAGDPVVRAAVMAGVYLIGTLLERKTDAFNTIGVAALIILLLRPQDLFDVGFQLSFAAVFSIVYFYHRLNSMPWVANLNKKWARHTVYRYVSALLLVSLSAQIGIIPLAACYFNRIPILSLAVNIIAVPAAFLMVALGFTTVLFGIVSPWISSVYGALNNEIITLFIKIISSIGNAPFSHVSVFTPSIFGMLTYLFFVLLLFHVRHQELRKKFAFLLLMGINLVIWKAALADNAGKLTWVQFDVGQGDAAVLHLPRNKTILIDGGNKTPFFDNGERVIAPYLRSRGIRRLDAVILSHPHDDHVGGLSYILENFKTDNIITSPARFESPLYDELREIAKRKHIPVRTVTAPDSLIFPCARLHFLSPDSIFTSVSDKNSQDVNNLSLVTRVLFGNTKLLLMGDSQMKAEKYIMRSDKPLDCDAVKIGHHGSMTSSTVPFLRRARPQHAVISVGENNRFGHPSGMVIRRLQALGAAVHRTDRSGAVVFRSDGKTLRQIHWNR